MTSVSIVTYLILVSSALAYSKTKKVKREMSEVIVSTVQLAQKEIEVDPKVQVSHSSSPQSTGVLVVKAPPLYEDEAPARFPIGVHLDLFKLSGELDAINGNRYKMADLGVSMIPSLRLGKIPFAAKFFDELAVSFGYYRSQLSYDTDNSLSVAHSSLRWNGQNSIYRFAKWNFSYALELGFLQSQISSTQNGLANVTRKSGLAGLGLLSQYQVQEDVVVDFGISYRNTFAQSKDYVVEPMSVGAGLSYIW